MANLLKTTVSIGSTEIVLASLALIKNKYLAVSVGPSGLGMYSLLNNFFLTVSIFVAIWLDAGITKYISEYHYDNKTDKTNQIFTLSLVIIIVLGTVISLILFISSSFILRYILCDSVPKVFYFLFLGSFIFINLRIGFMAMLKGMMNLNVIVISRVISSVVDIILIITIVYLYNIWGFFCSLPISALFGVIIIYWLIKAFTNIRLSRVNIKSEVAKKLFTFGGITLLLGLINLGSQYIQRIIILQNLGITDLGVFYAGVTIMEYLSMFSRASLFYFIPLMSINNADDHKVTYINKYIFFVMLINIPICVGTTLFGELCINTMFSNRFLGIIPSFNWFVLATFINCVGAAFQFTLVGSAKLSMHVISTIAIHGSWVLIPWFRISNWGLSSLAIAFVVGGLIGMTLNYIYLHKSINLRLSKRNSLLFSMAIFALILSKFIVHQGIIVRIITLIIITGITMIFITKDELSEVVKIIRRRAF